MGRPKKQTEEGSTNSTENVILAPATAEPLEVAQTPTEYTSGLSYTITDVKVEDASPLANPLAKVKLLGDLANACSNPEVVRVLTTLPNGHKIYELFVATIDKELNRIIGGGEKKDDAPQHLQDTAGTARYLQQVMEQFKQLMVGFMQTPLVKVLATMNKNLGGKEFQFQPNGSQQPQGNSQPQQPAQSVDQSYSDEPRRGSPGLGTY